jgi:5-methylcytosine-specific restriction endonuclease McrA
MSYKPRPPDQVARNNAIARERYKNKTKEEKAARVARSKQWGLDHKERYREIQAKCYSNNKEKRDAYQEAWWDSHPQKRAEYAAKADKEQLRKRGAEYKAKNPERVAQTKREYRMANRAIINAKGRAYSKRNPERNAVRAQNRRARIKHSGGTISEDIAKQLKTAQRGRCGCCRKKLIANGYHLDHIMPLALGGAHKDANMQLLCAPCNLEKNAKHPLDFMRSRGFLL